MNLRNLLYKQQLRERNSFQTRDHTGQNQRKYQKQLQNIEISLTMMNMAFKNNIKIQEIYLHLVRIRSKKLDFKQKDIKNVYKVLSDNKTEEIIFDHAYEKDLHQKKDHHFMNSTMRDQTLAMSSSCTPSRFKEIAATCSARGSTPTAKNKPTGNSMKVKFKSSLKDDSEHHGDKTTDFHAQVKGQSTSFVSYCMKSIALTYNRLYSRLVETKIKKLTYYIANKQYLQRVILHTMSEFSKRLETLIRRIFDFRDFKFLYDVIKLIYEENFIMEQKIYELLVNEGHVVSMEEFFRINGNMVVEDSEGAKRRNSRNSVLSTKRISVLTNQPIVLNEMKFQIQTKESQFAAESGKKSKSKKKKNKTPKDTFNTTHADKINKQIEAKYALALDKLGEIIEKSNQDLALFQQQNQMPEMPDQQIYRKKSQKSEGSERFIARKSSIQMKKRNSSFQYFSSSFKEIIKQLDEKKGKSQFMAEAQEARGSTHSIKNNEPQYQKISNETESLKNPTNVARLLNKKFKTYMENKSSKSRSVNSNSNTNKRKPTYSSRSNRHKTIRKLLKIYQSKNSQNEIIDKLFGTNFQDQDQQSLQRNFIKLSIMAKLKDKNIEQMKGNQLEWAKFEDFMMKEIQKEYQEMCQIKRENRRMRTRGGGFMQFIADHNENEQNNEKSLQKKRKTINLSKSLEKNDSDLIKKEEETFFNTEVKVKKDELNISAIDSKLSLNQSHIKSNHFQTTCRSLRATHQPNLSENQLALASHLNRFQCFQPNEFKKFETTYGQFTNPVTKTTGYYNQQDYKSLRISLQKYEVNSIMRLRKKGERNKNVFNVGSSVTIWNNGKKNHPKSCQKLSTTVNLETIKDVDFSQKQSSRTLKVKPFQTLACSKTERDLFEHQVLKKIVKLDNQNSQDTTRITTPIKKKLKRPQQLKIVRLQNARKSNEKLENLSLEQNPVENKEISLIKTKKHFEKINYTELNPLKRQFCLNAQKIQKPSFQLNQDDLDGFIERYLKENKNLEESQNLYGKINDPVIKKNLTNAINSLPLSPRHSFKRIKNLYSTNRHTKLI